MYRITTLLTFLAVLPLELAQAQGRFDDFESYAPGTALQSIDPLGNTPALWANSSTPAFRGRGPTAPRQPGRCAVAEQRGVDQQLLP